MLKVLRGLVWVIVLAAVGGGGYVYWQKHVADKAASVAAARAKESEQINAPAISVVKAVPADFVETAAVNGSLIAREETLVSPEIEGYRVLELFADEGDTVKKGQVLARLVADQLEAQIAQNEASKANAEAGIERAKSQIVEAEARVDEAKAQLERAIPLKKSGYLSQSTFDQRESAARTSEAQLAAAKDSLRAAEAAKSQVVAQRRELDWRRGNTEVRAPTDGIVSRRNARLGAMATAAGEPMFRIIQNGEIELDAEIVETELGRVKAGQIARVSVPGAAEVVGKVRLVSPEIDKTTRLGRAKILLGKDESLRIGAFARGVIETAKSRGIAVPPASVMFGPEGAYVQMVVNDKVERRNIKTGLVAGGKIEVTSGLNDGDMIVARAGTFLREGDKVTPVVVNSNGASANTAEVN